MLAAVAFICRFALLVSLAPYLIKRPRERLSDVLKIERGGIIPPYLLYCLFKRHSYPPKHSTTHSAIPNSEKPMTAPIKIQFKSILSPRSYHHQLTVRLNKHFRIVFRVKPRSVQLHKLAVIVISARLKLQQPLGISEALYHS